MYSDKFVVAIKVGGKVLRETKDLVTLPFGSEFSVLVKNLNSRRAKFILDIDGTNALDGQEIIVNANSEVEMKRFIRNGNMNEGNAFKFIERTTAIEDGPRGIKVDDGVVRVEFWFEKEVPEIKTTYHNDVWWNTYNRPPPFGGIRYGHYDSYTSTAKGAVGNSDSGGSTLSSASLGSVTRGMNVQTQTAEYAVPQNASVKSVVSDVGITVPGSKVEQQFTPVYGFNSEAASSVIILRLAGKVGSVEVVAPVTVHTKNICSTCSHTNKANSRFCSQCGTSLELI